MCYSEKAEAIISNFEQSGLSVDEIEDKIQPLIEQACDHFDECIEIDPNNIYAHDSEIRVLLKSLDFGFKIHGSINRELFISNPKNDWYSRNLDKISNLLEDGLYIIEQAKGLENLERINKSAGYLHECEAKFFKVLGKSIEAKNKFQNLIKNTPAGHQFMIPHYRRMYINCLLASKSKNQRDLFNAWAYISENELEESVKYLSDNILEDATNTYNIRLWLQAIRFLKSPPSISDCITKIGM
jgi:tetratricopeptide (TPR) repeat protein